MELATASGTDALGREPNGGRTQSRVLIVDDRPSARQAAKQVLELRGYLVAGEADSGAAAVEAAARLEPDWVLLDINLGDSNGFEISARLTNTHPDLDVVLTSATYDEYSRALLDQCGARAFVPKAKLAQVELARFWS
jgi:DNA-binding NarL/FixJ family response regulator